MSKQRRLLALRSRIIDEVAKPRWEDVWFFPRHDGVAGFLGTAPIMFVGVNPSTGTFPSRGDEFFYRVLRRYGFRNAHLTDVIKIRRRNQSLDELFNKRRVLGEAKRYFKEECRIIAPKLIVYLGPSFERYFEVFRRVTPSIASVTIPHYAPLFKRSGWRGKFRTGLRRVRRCYEKL